MNDLFGKLSEYSIDICAGRGQFSPSYLDWIPVFRETEPLRNWFLTVYETVYHMRST